VLVSTTTVPAPIPSRIPPGPVWAAIRAASSARLHTTTSEEAAASAALFATSAPISPATASAFSAVRFQTTVRKPAPAMRRAIAAPMRPMPMTLTVMSLISTLLGRPARSAAPIPQAIAASVYPQAGAPTGENHISPVPGNSKRLKSLECNLREKEKNHV